MKFVQKEYIPAYFTQMLISGLQFRSSTTFQMIDFLSTANTLLTLFSHLYRLCYVYLSKNLIVTFHLLYSQMVSFLQRSYYHVPLFFTNCHGLTSLAIFTKIVIIILKIHLNLDSVKTYYV